MTPFYANAQCVRKGYTVTRQLTTLTACMLAPLCPQWERYIECVPRPSPLFDSDLNGYVLTLQERAQKVLDDTLNTCQDNELVRI